MTLILKGLSQSLDDYSAIILKALADRFAEAFAEWAHMKVEQNFGAIHLTKA